MRVGGVLRQQNQWKGMQCAGSVCRGIRAAMMYAAMGIQPVMAGGVQTLETIEVTAQREGLIGEASTASEGTVTAAQLENRPLLRPAEVLEVVPGLVISQHSGDGKANQYYLRGFNLDHGTDFATTVMGMPVNMRTHGHGQGYSDLNFLIPELVDRLQYRKGTYAADTGDFATAGSASIEYARKVDAPYVSMTLGEHNYRRGLLVGSPAIANGNLLYGLEWLGNDGPWQVPESMERLNGVLRYSEGTRANGWVITAMGYKAAWTSTDQVPQRAISSGLIDRFGNLDPSDGGRTERYSVSGEWSAKGEQGWSRANAYFIDYSLDLWSNFTFCTQGCPAPGDQFHQADRRKVYGFEAAHTWYREMGGFASDWTLGVQSRLDRIGKVALSLSTQRQDQSTIRNDQVNEGSIGLYGENQTQWHDKFRSIVGVRADFYSFYVRSDTAANSGRVRDHIFSPKLALIFGPWNKTEYYFNAGYGFHSNDARGTTITVNPDSRCGANFGTANDCDGNPLKKATPLVRAKSYELGLRTAIVPGLQSSLSLWRLDLASELLFVGDAGTTVASSPSRRTGVEWANYWTPMRGMMIDVDLAVSRSRFTQDTGSGSYIPGALEKTASIGATYDSGGAWSGGVRVRYFGPRPLIEDNSVRSMSSTLVNVQLGYKLSANTKLTLDVLNLFNRQTSDIDYYYESQLAGEGAAVNDVHTHPAEPRALRLGVRMKF